MKLQFKLAILFTSLLCGFFVQDVKAQPAGSQLAPDRWRFPNIVNPQDVRIGSTTSIATNDRYADFLRFSSPVDIDVRIEGDARWYPDPQAALFVMNGSTPQQVDSDDDGGPHRDFLIQHRLLANRTYILQVGTRTSTNTLVTITTNQIALHGQLGSHAPQSQIDLSGILFGGSAPSFPKYGRRVEANWNDGTDFGTCMFYWGQNNRSFSVQNFARNQSTFRIDEVSISPVENPFVFRTNPVPQEHADSFEASIVDDSEINVSFNPKTDGVIKATMLVKYSYDGRRLIAAVPLSGRGLMFFPRTHTHRVTGLGSSVYSTFNYRIGSNVAVADGPVWMNLEFDAPVTDVTVLIIPRRGTEVIASLYGSRYNYQNGEQLRDYTSYLLTNLSVGRQSQVKLKVSLPTEEVFSLAEFDVHVFARR